MMINKRIFKLGLMIFCLFLFCYCNSKDPYIGRKIIFPENSVFKKYAKDVVDFSYDTEYKVLFVVDSLECVSCRLNLYGWDFFLSELNQLAPGQVSYLFYLDPIYTKELILALRVEDFSFPVCIDNTKDLFRLNPFFADESDKSVYTFLLNKHNEILLEGDPLLKEDIRALYINTIKNN